MFRSFGPMEIGLILVIILIVFGVGKLPQIGGAIGKGIHEFRKATRGETSEDKSSDLKSDAKPKAESDEKPVKS
jgi:sec-independent protein translocase protein TatA